MTKNVSFDRMDNPVDRERVLFYFVKLYPNYVEMDLEDRWYAEDSKDIIATYLRFMDQYDSTLRILRPELNAEERTQQAFKVALTKHYSGLLGNTSDETYFFISEHLDDINRRFIDSRDLTEAKYLDFDPAYAVASAIADIKLENRQKEIK